VHLDGVTSKPDGLWVARNLVAHWDSLRFRFLIRDCDAKCPGGFDEAFWSESTEIIRTPIRAALANVFAERFVGTLRKGVLGSDPCFRAPHLEPAPQSYVAHYNGRWPDRST
jgi:hypothetical protein